MGRIINTLIIDDHPSIITAYKNYLSNYEKQQEQISFVVSTALNADEALSLLNDPNCTTDLLFLDISIPSSSDGKFRSGEDIGIFVKKKKPDCKIIVITGYFENLVLREILNNINPDSLLFKSDVNGEVITSAITNALESIPYYSKAVLSLIRQKFSSGIYLDKIDKQLLFELHNGTRTKDLTNKLPLSPGGIERRKRILRELFDVAAKDDKMLLTAAIEKGFL
jgi:DNA-binding NarL/FixJ family response regulator